MRFRLLSLNADYHDRRSFFMDPVSPHLVAAYALPAPVRTYHCAAFPALQALWGNYTAAMDELGGFNTSVPVYVASGLLTYLSLEGAGVLFGRH